jgi:flagella basal body P-ring formation protein FlgA
MMKPSATVLLVLMAATTIAASTAVTPAEAIRVAVLQRLGVPGVAEVTHVTTKVADEAGLVAEPEATARLGKPARFVLSVGGVRRGVAVATVTVVCRHPKASRSIAREEAIDGSAIDLSEGPLRGVPIRRLLTMEALAGLAARRAIAAGEPLTAAVLHVPPVVKSGDSVDVTVRIGLVSVTGTGIASGSGQVGDVIRVMQPNSSRLLTGRIVGTGAVEIVQ